MYGVGLPKSLILTLNLMLVNQAEGTCLEKKKKNYVWVCITTLVKKVWQHMRECNHILIKCHPTKVAISFNMFPWGLSFKLQKIQFCFDRNDQKIIHDEFLKHRSYTSYLVHFHFFLFLFLTFWILFWKYKILYFFKTLAHKVHFIQFSP